jgi:hypothetical protein
MDFIIIQDQTPSTLWTTFVGQKVERELGTETSPPVLRSPSFAVACYGGWVVCYGGWIAVTEGGKANGGFSVSSHRGVGPMGRPPARKGEPTPRKEAGN